MGIHVGILACAALALLAPAMSRADSAQDALDKDPTPVRSCAFEDIRPYSIQWMNYTETTDMCERMKRAFTYKFSVSDLRIFSKTVALLSLKGWNLPKSRIAYQVASVIEARGQDGDQERLKPNLEMMLRIFLGTEGRVTPQDINVMLRNAGPVARTLSDEGIMKLAAVISVDKRKRGE